MADMDNLPFDLSNLSREDMDRMMSGYNSDATDISPLFTKGGARAAVQGLTFGTGDEVEAAVRSLVQDGVSFNDALTQVQGEINKFSEENLTVKRPGSGLSPINYWDVLGQTSEKTIEFDDIIE